MKSYINDYKINVIEIKKNNLNLQNKNKGKKPKTKNKLCNDIVKGSSIN